MPEISSETGDELGETIDVSETEEPNVPLRFVEELNIEIRVCCFQTSRLNELYCWCGRSTPVELRELFRTKHVES